MTTTAPTTGETTSFADLGLAPDLAEALTAQGITTPFPIQELTLNLALAGADIIGQARTGTGKTLAFGLPMLQRVDVDDRRVQTLVIVPTRELCLQVAEDLEGAGNVKGVGVLAVYGGKSLDPQMDALRKGGIHVVVGTPGRLLDLLRRGVLNLSTVRGLVLDEADEMLDLGFLPDVEQLIEATPQRRQTLLFSATMPSAVVALARRYMQQPTFLRADVEEVHIGPKTEQHFFSCHRMDKPAVLARILQSPNRGLCVVFSRTKRMCDILAEELRERGIAAAPIHSDLRQESREKALTRFREGKIDVLVATEVAARGLDIDDVTHVVNYDCPDDEKMYLHRIGRTGRAGAAGVAITLAVWNELARLNMIKRALDIDVETHEVFSTSPILDELFDLPPREERPKAKAGGRDGGTRGREGATRGRGKGADEARGRGDHADEGGRRGGGKAADGADKREAGGAGRGRGAKAEGEARRRAADRAGGGAETAEAEQAAEPDAGTRTASEAAAPKIRRRSRRRPGERAEEGERSDVTREPTAEAPGEASGGDAGEAHVRRRTHARTTDRRGAAAKPEAGETTADEATAGQPRVRTRTRTRSSEERPSGRRAGLSGPDEGGAPPEAGPARGDAVAEGTTDDGAAGSEAAGAGEQGAAARDVETRRRRTRVRRSSTAARPRRDAGEGRTGAAEAEEADAGAEERAGRDDDGDGDGRRSRGPHAGGNGDKPRGKRKGGRSTRGKSKRSGARERSSGAGGRAAAPVAAIVTTEQARGQGRPRLRRPLEVAHLP